ncbi:MAG: hypothetical protein WBA57_20445 [Elainellaceae cyanobacterium]
MNKFLRVALIASAALSPLLVQSDRPALSQERQGCFMVNNVGQMMDLSDICPQPEVFVTSGTPDLGTGDIQVTLRWTTTDDLDLAVTDPSGEVVAYYNPSIPSGGQLDVDANAGCSGETNSPIENVFWPVSQAPQGSYTIAVNLFSRCTQNTGPIPFEIRLLVQGTVQTLSGTVGDGSETSTFPFSLPLQ